MAATVKSEDPQHLQEESTEDSQELLETRKDPRKHEGAGDPPDGDDDALSLPVRLMLSCELLGHEAAIGFKDLYAIPNLQALGLPMSLVSLTGLISGPAAIIILPLMGWFSDSGTNTVRRRTYVLIITTVILMSGTLTVIIANSLPFRSCESGEDVSKPSPETSLGVGNSSTSFDSNGSRLCENKSCNIEELQSPDDLISLPTTISVTSQEPGASSTRESSERVQSMTGSLGTTFYMTKSSERLSFVTDSSEGAAPMRESPETTISMTESSEKAISNTESSQGVTNTTESSERAISNIMSSEGTISMTESSERATSMTVSSERASSMTKSSERATSMTEAPEILSFIPEGATFTTESSERTTTTVESVERTISTTKSSEVTERATVLAQFSEGAVFTKESSEGAIVTTESSERATSRTHSSEGATSIAESSERATSIAESSERATSIAESSERATSMTEFSERATAVTESPENVSFTTESPERATSMTESSERATSMTESPERATSMTESSERATSVTKSLQTLSSMTESLEGATFTTESSERATFTTESSERATFTTESSERETFMTESSEGTMSSTGSSKRATHMTLSSERATFTSESSKRAITMTESSERAISTKESSERATSMTKIPENSSFITEGATTTMESVERAISTTESSEVTERATVLAQSSGGAMFTTESSERATSRTVSSERATSITETSERATSKTETSEKSTPCSLVAAGVAMFGYITMEIGFQSLTSYIRTWMLMCSPPSAPTPTLVAGLVMTSLGGMLTSGLSMVDLASVLGLSSESRSGLATQITIQAVAVLIPLVTGLILSLLIGLRQLKLRHAKHQHQHDQQQQPNGAFIAQEHTISTNDLESSTGFQNHTESAEPTTDSSDLGHARTSDSLSKPISTSPTESAQNMSPELPPNFPDENQFTDNLSKDSTHSPSKPTTNYGAIEKETSLSNAANASKNPSINDASGDCSSQERLLRNESNRFHCPCLRPLGLRVTMALLICSAYFNFGGVTINKMTVSDFVGKAIFGGDPAAAPGTEDLQRYQEGLRAASYGFLVYYACYLAFSFVQKPVLACMGYTAEFVTVTVAMALCLVLVSVTARLEMYFLLSAVSGVQRGVFNVVSVAIVSHLVHAEAKRRDDSKGPQLGLGVSAMFATLPLSYCTLYPWVGALAQMTGVPGAPLLLAAASACVSAVLFCFVRA